VARSLLNWIVDKVIGERRARAFLLRQGHEADPLITSLYNSRVLHVIKRGIAARDQPGVRYDVFAIDYGCYVELLTTARAPAGLLGLEEEDEVASALDVPLDDYRSIRRAILDLDEFRAEAA
jgi:hypothetical protein